MDMTQRSKKNPENFRAETESGACALHFDRISQLSWKSDQKGGIVKKKTTGRNGVT